MEDIALASRSSLAERSGKPLDREGIDSRSARLKSWGGAITESSMLVACNADEIGSQRASRSEHMQWTEGRVAAKRRVPRRRRFVLLTSRAKASCPSACTWVPVPRQLSLELLQNLARLILRLNLRCACITGIVVVVVVFGPDMPPLVRRPASPKKRCASPSVSGGLGFGVWGGYRSDSVPPSSLPSKSCKTGPPCIRVERGSCAAVQEAKRGAVRASGASAAGHLSMSPRETEMPHWCRLVVDSAGSGSAACPNERFPFRPLSLPTRQRDKTVTAGGVGVFVFWARPPTRT